MNEVHNYSYKVNRITGSQDCYSIEWVDNTDNGAIVCSTETKIIGKQEYVDEALNMAAVTLRNKNAEKFKDIIISKEPELHV